MTVKVPDFVQTRLISKMETFMLVAEFQYDCFIHTYIFLFVESGQCATKKLKSLCGPAKLKDNKKLKLDR